jgi:glycosyltransferase involved in cell wall biosynthesis
MIDHMQLKNVSIVDQQAPLQLVRYYVAADTFVLPSLVDVWGLVVNEALCCGTPVLGSEYAGAVQELLPANNVGVVFDPHDSEDFATKLLNCCVVPLKVPAESCRRAVATHTFDDSFVSIRRMIETLVPRLRARLCSN